MIDSRKRELISSCLAWIRYKRCDNDDENSNYVMIGFNPFHNHPMKHQEDFSAYVPPSHDNLHDFNNNLTYENHKKFKYKKKSKTMNICGAVFRSNVVK